MHLFLRLMHVFNMAIQLINSDLIVGISEKGAELSSIKSRTNNIEYLWQGNPLFWGRKAPVLFPIVGRLQNDVYELDGKKYHLNQHGFARDYEFKVVRQNETMVSFCLKSDISTRKIYPFDFSLNITYTLNINTIKVTYVVENLNDDSMYFSIGAHPGFNIPLVENTTFGDYYITFTPNNPRIAVPLVGPYLDIRNKTMAQLEKCIPLTWDLFDHDALIFETTGQNTVTIKSDKTEHFVSLSYEDFPYVGIWSPPKKEAPFVCLEPWLGITDTIDANGDLKEKLGIISLEGGQSFSADYSITIG